MRLADIMVERGYLSEKTIGAVMRIQEADQKKKRQIVLAAACGVLAIAAVAVAVGRMSAGDTAAEPRPQRPVVSATQKPNTPPATTPVKPANTAPGRQTPAIGPAALPAASATFNAPATPPMSMMEEEIERRTRESERQMFPAPSRTPGEDALFPAR
jgi:hypothetical protein